MNFTSHLYIMKLSYL